VWTPTASMSVARTTASSALLPSGLVLVAGGANPALLNGAELFDPLHTAAVAPARSVAVELAPARPNPFVRSTQIAYTLPGAGHVRLAVYDVRGRLLTTLVDRDHAAGGYAATWNGRTARGARADAGVYFARLTVTGAGEPQVRVERLTLAR